MKPAIASKMSLTALARGDALSFDPKLGRLSVLAFVQLSLGVLIGYASLVFPPTARADEVPPGSEAAMAAVAAVRWQPWTAVVVFPERLVSARLQAREDAPLAFEVAGRVQALPVRLGDRVAAGDVVARLEREPFVQAVREAEAALAAAQARVRQAERLRQQAERLRRERAASDEAVQSAREKLEVAQLEAARAEALLAQARWRLERTELHAPYDGVIVERLAALGQWMGAGQAVLRLRTVAAEAFAEVPRAWLDGLAQAVQQGQVRFEALDGTSYTVAGLSEAGVTTRAGEMVAVRLTVAAEAPAGGVGRLRWRDPMPHLPAAVLSTHRGDWGVWVREAADATPRFLSLPKARAGQPLALTEANRWPASREVAVFGQGALAWQKKHGDSTAPVTKGHDELAEHSTKMRQDSAAQVPPQAKQPASN